MSFNSAASPAASIDVFPLHIHNLRLGLGGGCGGSTTGIG